MPQFKVNVKWGKEKFSDIELTTEEAPDVFKLQLFSLTNVLPERQKVMLKGMTIRDNWNGFKLKNGITLLLLGTAEELPQEPAAKTVFVEDMTEDQLASALDLVTGLDNLGNTCYMNATVQLLSSVPELESALENQPQEMSNLALMASLGGGGGNLDTSITASLRNLMREIKAKEQVSIKPFIFLQLLYARFPHFAEKNDHGQPMQQDANEFLTELLRICQQNLKPLAAADAATPARQPANFIDQYFGIECSNKLECVDDEAKDEPPTESKETSLQLNCFISQEVKYMLTGIKSKLKEEITKHSPTLGRDAKYMKTSQITRLPAYVCVQMVRFFFKEKGNVNAKILKDVKFPMSFDAYELCSGELQKRLQPVRDRFEADEEARAEAQIQGKGEKGKKKVQVATEEKDAAPKEYERFDFEDDIGSNNSGYYDLQGIITHQGRSSSSGHYVAWLRKKADEWLKCDDDHVTPVSSEEVLKLSGGGDWHIAYVLLYGPRRLEKAAPASALQVTAAAAAHVTNAMETSSNGDAH